MNKAFFIEECDNDLITWERLTIEEKVHH